MLVPVSKKLQLDRNRLVSSFIKKNEGDFPRQHARVIDDYFCERYEESKIGPQLTLKNNPYAIIALGGYGRQEQCIFSDIDLLILFRRHVPAEAGSLVQEIVYPLDVATAKFIYPWPGF